MRLLMLNPFYPPYFGGTEKHVYEVSRRLAKNKNFEVTVLTAQLPHTPLEEVSEGVRIVRMPAVILTSLPHPLPPPVPLYFFTWPDFLREVARADAVHIHNRFVYSVFELFAIRRLLKKPLGLTLHNARPQGIDVPTDFVGGLYDDVFGRKIMENCRRIAGVSKNTLDMTVPKDVAARVKTQVIYNGVDFELFNAKNSGDEKRRELGLEGKQVVLTVCRLVEQKGVDYLLEAIPAVEKEMKGKVHFVLLGRGPRLKHLQEKVRSLGVEDHVSFLTEWYSTRDVSSLYAMCDCFALPSLWEPFGIVLAEAMASEKAVVGTDVGGIPEIVEHGKSGFLVPTRDSRALAERIIQVLQDPEGARRMGRVGRKSVLGKFNWDESARGYEKFYADLL